MATHDAQRRRAGSRSYAINAERRARGRKTPASAQGRHDDERARLPEAKIREILKKAIQIVQENNKAAKKD